MFEVPLRYSLAGPAHSYSLQDLRNHGDSLHDPRHDYVAMSEDVENFIDEHNLKRPVLMGHSM
jgi:pimeloyl-ACP methyl ester carboxylesterase